MIAQRGDTIIEVIFAITVFALVSVLAITSMNQGSAIAQRSLEIELVRQEIDAQADALRYIHGAYLSDLEITDPSSPKLEKKRWQSISEDRRVRSAQVYTSIVDNNQKCNRLPTTAFAIGLNQLRSRDPKVSSIRVDSTPTYAQIDESTNISNGLWIEAVRPADTDKFYDFHIRACWYVPGKSGPMVLGSIVRLYDPEL